MDVGTSAANKLTATALAGVAGVLAFAPAATAASSTVELSYASVYGVNSTVIINRLPIETADGKVIYKDVTINLKADAKGLVTVAPATPAQKLSFPLPVANFTAGLYLSQDGKSGFVLAGPSPLSGTSVSKWTLSSTAGRANPTLLPANFYVGPVNQSPLFTRIKAAKITNKEYSYGTSNADAYYSGYLIGVSQLGKQIEIANFSYHGDQSNAVSTTIYNFVK